MADLAVGEGDVQPGAEFGVEPLAAREVDDFVFCVVVVSGSVE